MPFNLSQTEDHISTKEAAEIADCTIQHISRLCRTGEIEANKNGRQWLVSESSLREYLDLVLKKKEEQRRMLSESYAKKSEDISISSWEDTDYPMEEESFLKKFGVLPLVRLLFVTTVLLVFLFSPQVFAAPSDHIAGIKNETSHVYSVVEKHIVKGIDTVTVSISDSFSSVAGVWKNFSSLFDRPRVSNTENVRVVQVNTPTPPPPTPQPPTERTITVQAPPQIIERITERTSPNAVTHPELNLRLTTLLSDINTRDEQLKDLISNINQDITHVTYVTNTQDENTRYDIQDSIAQGINTKYITASEDLTIGTDRIEGQNTIFGNTYFDTNTLSINAGTGRVGIGTTSPQSTLDIYGDLILSGTDRYLNFSHTTGASGYGIRDNAGIIEFKNNAGSWTGIGSGGGGGSGSWSFFNNSGIRLATTTNQVLIGASATTSTQTLEVIGGGYFSGNVGIGTASPATALNVRTDVNGTQSLLFENINSGAFAGSGFTAKEANNQFVQLIYSNSGASGSILSNIASSAYIQTGSLATGGFSLISQADAPIRFAVGGNAISDEVMRIDSTGNIGIGTTSPYANFSIDHDGGEIPFAIGSSTATSFIINEDGKVGIGTNDPGSNMLEIFKDASADTNFNVRNATGNSGIILTQDNSTQALRMSYISSNYSAFGMLKPNAGVIYTREGATNGLSLITATDAPIVFGTGGYDAADERMRITGTGNIGIGTTSPYAKLSVVGEVVASHLTATSTTENTNLHNALYVNSSTGQVAVGGSGFEHAFRVNGSMRLTGTLYLDSNANSGVISWSGHRTTYSTFRSHIFKTWDGSTYATALQIMGDDASAQHLLYTGNGNVGVGTTSPYAKISIDHDEGDIPFAIGSSTATSFIIDEGGNVGIGTASPGYSLEVSSGSSDSAYFNNFVGIGAAQTGSELLRVGGDIRASGNLEIGATGNINAAGTKIIERSGSTIKIGQTSWWDTITFSQSIGEVARFSTTGNFGLGTTSPNAKLSVTGSGTGTGKAFAVEDSAGTSRFVIQDDGSVGIGTQSPSRSFTLSGDGSDILIEKDDGTDQALLYSIVGGGSGLGLYGSNDSLAIHLDSTGTTGSITSTGVINTGDGSDAAPSLTFASDTDTGIYRGGTNLLTLVTAATDRLTITATGAVGIGTTTPNDRLVINHDLNAGIGQTIVNPSSDSGAFTYLSLETSDFQESVALSYYNENTDFGGVLAPNQGALFTGANANNGLAISTYANAPIVFSTDGIAASDERLRITGSGNIGISTTSPFARLSVTHEEGESAFAVGSSTATSFIIDEGGNVGIGTASPEYDLDVVGDVAVSTGNSIYVNREDGHRIRSNGGNLTITAGGSGKSLQLHSVSSGVLFQPGNSTKGIFTSDGDFGVGTTSPGQLIHVAGGNIRVDNTSAAAGVIVNRTDGAALGLNAGLNTSAFRFDESKTFTIQAQSSANIISGSGSGITNVFAINSSGNMKVGTVTSHSDVGSVTLHASKEDAVTNDVTQLLRLTHTTSGTPAAGIGAGIGFEVETADGNNEMGARIEAVLTDVTSTSENFDLTFLLMNEGAASAEVGRFTSGGDLGIGTTTPWRTLSVAGTAAFSGLTNDGTGYYACISTSGELATSTTACGASSERFKQNIQPLTYGLNDVLQLDPVSFLWKEDFIQSNARNIGFIAEDVEKIIPEVIGYDPDGQVMNLDYPKLTAVLVKAVKELDAKLSAMEAGVASTGKTFTAVSTSIQRVFQLVADKIVAVFIKTDHIQVEEGITIKDKKTGEYYCILVSEGDLEHVLGRCEDLDESPTDTVNTPSSSDSQEEVEDIEDVTATSTEGVPEETEDDLESLPEEQKQEELKEEVVEEEETKDINAQDTSEELDDEKEKESEPSKEATEEPLEENEA